MARVNATCARTCYDSARNALYEQGKQYEIDDESPIAKHFGIKPAEKQAAPKRGKKDDPATGSQSFLE